MNTLRNFAALALLALAAISPARAEQADEAKQALRALANRPEIAALAADGKGQAIAEALQQQLGEQSGDGQSLKALATDENKAAVAAALNGYLAQHPLKEGENLSDLTRKAKQKAVAEALKARFGKGR
ncbi:hypothetical protein [Lysobacter terrae]